MFPSIFLSSCCGDFDVSPNLDMITEDSIRQICSRPRLNTSTCFRIENYPTCKYDVKDPVLIHSLTPLLLFPLPLTLPAPGTCCLPASSIGIVSVSLSPVEQCLDTKPSALYTLHNVSTMVLHTDTGAIPLCSDGVIVWQVNTC